MATRGRRVPAANTTHDLVSALNLSMQNFSLQFLGMMSILAFVLAVVWSTQDRDILFMSPLPLPIVKINVSLYGFYLVTPFVVIMLHISLSAELHILLRRLSFLDDILSRPRNSPQWNALRAMLSGSPYFNIASGLHSGWFFAVFVRILFYMSFFLFPIFTLLAIQWRAIALHDIVVTRTQQTIIALELLAVTALFIQYNLTLWRAVRLLAGLFIICVISICLLTIPISNEPWTERPWVWVPQSAIFRDGEAPSWSSIRTFAKVFFLSRNLTLRKQIIVPDGYNPNTFFDHMARDGCIATDDRVRGGLSAFSRDFRFADFSGSVVVGADFGGEKTILDNANFDSSNIMSTNYQNASLKHASFRAACLHDVNFTESNLDSTDMSLSTIALSSLNLAQAKRAKFLHSTIVNSSAVGAHLESSVFSNSIIISFNGRDSHMHGADFVNARILDADFVGAKAQLISLEGSTLLSVDATRIKAAGTQLTGATLTDVDFTDAMLEGSSFDEAHLLGVRFVGTHLSACSMRRMKNVIVDTATPHTELIAYSRATEPSVDQRTGEDVYASTLASILAPPIDTRITFKEGDSTKQLPAFQKSSNARALPSNGICGTTEGISRSCLKDSQMAISDRARAAFLAWMFCQEPDFVCPLLRLAIGSNRTGFHAFPELATLLLQKRASVSASLSNCAAMAALAREQVHSCYGASINDLLAQLYQLY